eukprot:526878-Prorocentrum_minimum.AAC.1
MDTSSRQRTTRIFGRYLTSPSCESRYAYIPPLRSTRGYATRLALVLGVAPNDRRRQWTVHPDNERVKSQAVSAYFSLPDGSAVSARANHRHLNTNKAVAYYIYLRGGLSRHIHFSQWEILAPRCDIAAS